MRRGTGILPVTWIPSFAGITGLGSWRCAWNKDARSSKAQRSQKIASGDGSTWRFLRSSIGRMTHKARGTRPDSSVFCIGFKKRI